MERSIDAGTRIRAKETIGTFGTAAAPNCFPLRIEQAWRAEKEAGYAAPQVPFQLPDALSIGIVRIDHLRKSIASACERHAALRTMAAVQNGRLIQSICSGVAVPVNEISIGSINGGGELGNALAYLENVPAIDLKSETGIRFYIFHANQGHVTLGVVAHHYICDNWSIRMLFKEISRGYSDISGGNPVSIQKPARQYLDYAVFQRDTLNLNLDAHLSFWREAIGDMPAPTLPSDVSADTRWMVPLDFTLGPNVYFLLRKTSKNFQVTNFSVALALYQIILARWAQSNSVLCAVSVADRDRAMFQHTFGYLISAVPVRSDFKRDVSFRRYVSLLTERMRGAFRYKALPYETYQEILGIDQSFCRTLFNYVSSGRVHALSEDNDLRADEPNFKAGFPFLKQFHHRDLFFQLRERSDKPGLSGRVFFCSGLFEAATLKRVIRDFTSLLETVARDPDVPVQKLLGL